MQGLEGSVIAAVSIREPRSDGYGFELACVVPQQPDQPIDSLAVTLTAIGDATLTARITVGVEELRLFLQVLRALNETEEYWVETGFMFADAPCWLEFRQTRSGGLEIDIIENDSRHASNPKNDVFWKRTVNGFALSLYFEDLAAVVPRWIRATEQVFRALGREEYIASTEPATTIEDIVSRAQATVPDAWYITTYEARENFQLWTAGFGVRLLLVFVLPVILLLITLFVLLFRGGVP